MSSGCRKQCSQPAPTNTWHVRENCAVATKCMLCCNNALQIERSKGSAKKHRLLTKHLSIFELKKPWGHGCKLDESLLSLAILRLQSSWGWNKVASFQTLQGIRTNVQTFWSNCTEKGTCKFWERFSGALHLVWRWLQKQRFLSTEREALTVQGSYISRDLFNKPKGKANSNTVSRIDFDRNFPWPKRNVPLSESATIPAGTAQGFQKHRHERQSSK